MIAELIILVKGVGWVMLIGLVVFTIMWPILDMLTDISPLEDDEDEWPDE